MAGRQSVSPWQVNQGTVKSQAKEGHKRDTGSDHYFGRKLVQKVYEDLSASFSKDRKTAWGASLAQSRKDIVQYAEETSKKTQRTPKDFVKRVAAGESRNKRNTIKIDRVHPLPNMIYWTETPLNIPTPDSKFLTHFPFLGDDHDKRDKKGTFSDELVQMYDGKIHSDDTSDEDPFYDQVIDFVHFIRVLMEIGKKFGNGILFDNHDVNELKSTEDLTSKLLQRIYKEVENVGEAEYALKKPSLKLLTAACPVFPNAQPDALQKRYLALSLSRNPEFNKSKNAPCNVDEAGLLEVQTKEVQMDSYRSVFCRLCFLFACPPHELLMSSDEISYLQSIVVSQRTKKTKNPWMKGRKKSVNDCKFKDCCLKDALEEMPPPPDRTEARRVWEKLLHTWTPTERTLFNCHFESYNDYCLVALLMQSKTCREVMEYHRMSMMMDIESQKQTSAKVIARGHSPPSPLNSDEVTSTTASSSGYESLNSSLNVTSELSNEEIVARQLSTFIPCCHATGVCQEDCICVIGKRNCESSCACFKSCKNRFRGCTCLTTCDSNRCPCFIAHRECDPDLCKNCGSHEMDLEKVRCKNIALQRKLAKSMYVAKSTVSGWGTFAGEDIKKGEVIDEYTAEMISVDEAEKRGHVYDEKRHTFLFELTESINLDASRMGSLSRFINSSKRPNCQPIKTNVRGEIRLAIRALRNIEKNSELFMNYHKALLSTSKRQTRGVKRCRKYLDE